MSKKTLKVISILTIIVCIIMAVSPVFAEIDPSKLTPKTDETAETAISGFAGKVMGLIRNIGIVAAVIILMVIGLKYLTGSAEEKADYKKSLMPYVVGVIVLFGASAIAQFVISFAKL